MYPNLNQMPDWENHAHHQQQQAPPATHPADIMGYLLQTLGLLNPLPTGHQEGVPPPSAPPSPEQPQPAPNAVPPPLQASYAPPPPPPQTHPNGWMPPAGWAFASTSPPPPHCEWTFNLPTGVLPHMRQLFRRSCRLAGWSTLVLLLLLIIGPGSLLRMAAFLTLATGLGLHLPTLVVGHLLYLVVSGLACAEPLLVAGLLFWAAHKLLVRRQPLLDRNYWRCHLQRSF